MSDSWKTALPRCRSLKARNMNTFGMTLDFNIHGELKITMIPYVKEIVELFSQCDNSKSTAAIPAAKHLFKRSMKMRILLLKGR